MWRILCILMLISLPVGFVAGCKYRAGQDAQASLEAGLRTVIVTRAQGQATTAIAVKDQAARDRIVYVTRTLDHEVHDAIPPASDLRLPVGWVRFHDAAALGLDLSQVPDPAGRPDAAPSEVVASAAASVVNANYGACTVDRQKLSDLQAWVTAQKALFDADPATRPP